MRLRELFVEIGLDVDSEPLNQFDRGITSLKKNVRRLTMVLFGATGAAAGLGYLLKKAGGFEQTQIAFEVMLGSAEKAKELLTDLFDFAKKTPFEIEGILETTKLLLGMGIEAGKMIKTMNFLGNIAAGLSIPISRLALNFGQVKAQGKLTGRELRDFAIAGVPLLDELAKMLGKSKAEITKMVSAGAIGFETVEKAFMNMTSEGGRFYNLMQRQSMTLLGIWSNLKDILTLFAHAIGADLLPATKKILNDFIKFLEVHKKIIKLKAKIYIKEIAKGLMFMAQTIKGIVYGIIELSEVFGGLGNMIKWVVGLFAAFMGLQILSGIGNIVLGIAGIVKALVFMGNAALLAQIKIVALPLLVGVALAALIIVLQDLKTFFVGGDSVTGRIIKWFEKTWPGAIDAARKKLQTLKKDIKDFFAPWETMKKKTLGDMMGVKPTSWWEDIAQRWAENEGRMKEMHAMGAGNNISTTNAPISQNINVNAQFDFMVPPGVSAEGLLEVFSEGAPAAIMEEIKKSTADLQPKIR